jgi:hypothetical protein
MEQKIIIEEKTITMANPQRARIRRNADHLAAMQERPH